MDIAYLVERCQRCLNYQEFGRCVCREPEDMFERICGDYRYNPNFELDGGDECQR